MNRKNLRPLLAAFGAVAVAVAALLLVGEAGSTPAPPSSDTPLGGVLSDADRHDLAAIPLQRGADQAPVDPSVDFTDPEAVARAYLSAARSVSPADLGRTHLRAAGYAAPGSPAATVGVVVIDAPPAGSVRTATVTALELIAADQGNNRRGYEAEIGTATGPPGGPVTVELVRGHIVLAHQSDGRWLVAADSPTDPDLSAGED